MTREQAQVLEFMIAFEQDCPKRYSIPSEKLWEFRKRLIDEEYKEMLEAYQAGDRVAFADAAGDLLYVLYGLFVSCGLDVDPIFQEIHRSNMSKFWKDSEVATRFEEDAQLVYQMKPGDRDFKDEEYVAKKIAAHRWIVKDHEGKVIKSPSYSEADIRKVLL